MLDARSFACNAGKGWKGALKGGKGALVAFTMSPDFVHSSAARNRRVAYPDTPCIQISSRLVTSYMVHCTDIVHVA